MRTCLVFLLSLFSTCLHAAVIFPGASVFESTRIIDTRYQLALGGMEKHNGVWRPEKSLRVSIDGQRDTHEIGYEATTDEVFRFYSDHFRPGVVKQLFSCEGLDCGSSAQWANGYFGVRELYGADIGQRLAVWLVEENSQQQVITLYVIQRGNRKVYAHVDIFNVMETLQTEAMRATLIGHVFDTQQLRSDELRDIAGKIRLAQKKGETVWLVGHAYSESKQSDNVVVGEGYARALADKLSLLGLKDLETTSVGMLAPLGEAAVDRVAVVATRQD
jgi:hypothetical protein